MHAQHALFQQGFSLLDDVHPYMKQLAAAVRRRLSARRHASVFLLFSRV